MSGNSRDVEALLVSAITDALGVAPAGELWAGDDCAVLRPLARPLLSTDLIVEGVHVDRRWCRLADMGFKAISVNVSDVAAMGGRARALVVAIAGATAGEVLEIMEGAREAAGYFDCPIVGGDLTDGDGLVICVTVLGEATAPPIRRDGAHVGDRVYLTGPLGASAAGLRELRMDDRSGSVVAEAHRRPRARAREGALLGDLGASAMIDCSDGLVTAAQQLADASAVALWLSEVPSATGATAEDAWWGGEDYELLFTFNPQIDPAAAFAAKGLDAPILLGEVRGGASGLWIDGARVQGRVRWHHFGEAVDP